MQMFNFDFMKAGNRDPIQRMRDLDQAKNHCRNLYEGCGRVMGAFVSVRMEDRR
jgi:hypothetical protein